MNARTFKYGAASVKLVPLSFGIYEMRNLWSDPKFRNRGHATKAVEAAMAWADKHQIVVLLVVQANGAGGMTNKQLQAFYHKFGFERDDIFDRPVRMVRRQG